MIATSSSPTATPVPAAAHVPHHSPVMKTQVVAPPSASLAQELKALRHVGALQVLEGFSEGMRLGPIPTVNRHGKDRDAMEGFRINVPSSTVGQMTGVALIATEKPGQYQAAIWSDKHKAFQGLRATVHAATEGLFLQEEEGGGVIPLNAKVPPGLPTRKIQAQRIEIKDIHQIEKEETVEVGIDVYLGQKAGRVVFREDTPRYGGAFATGMIAHRYHPKDDPEGHPVFVKVVHDGLSQLEWAENRLGAAIAGRGLRHAFNMADEVIDVRAPHRKGLQDMLARQAEDYRTERGQKTAVQGLTVEPLIKGTPIGKYLDGKMVPKQGAQVGALVADALHRVNADRNPKDYLYLPDYTSPNNVFIPEEDVVSTKNGDMPTRITFIDKDSLIDRTSTFKGMNLDRMTTDPAFSVDRFRAGLPIDFPKADKAHSYQVARLTSLLMLGENAPGTTHPDDMLRPEFNEKIIAGLAKMARKDPATAPVVDLLRKALDRNLEKRPSCKELAEALSRYARA